MSLIEKDRIIERELAQVRLGTVFPFVLQSRVERDRASLARDQVPLAAGMGLRELANAQGSA